MSNDTVVSPHSLYCSKVNAYVLDTKQYFGNTIFYGAHAAFKMHAYTNISDKPVTGFGIDYIGWSFGSNELFDYIDNHPDAITDLFAHELTHALDHYIRGDQHRLLKLDFGYSVNTGEWEIPAWTNEVRVLAMQAAALNKGNRLAGWSVGTDIRENRYKLACTGYLTNVLSSKARKRLGSNEYIRCFVNHMFDYWSTRHEYLKTEFWSMIQWLVYESGRDNLELSTAA